MSIGIFAVGCLFFIAGVAYLAHLMLLPPAYVVATVPVAVAVGFLVVAQRDRDRKHI